MTQAAARRIAYQGEPGAYSHLACRAFAPDLEPMACPTFEDAFAAVREGRAERAMIPLENSVAGRVSDIHFLLPDAGLFITAEHFLRVRHMLLGRKGARLEDVKTVASHAMALGQCRTVIRELGLTPVAAGDTAGAAHALAQSGRADQAAIASELAAEVYGLDILRAGIEDADHNTTRFLDMAREPDDAPYDGAPVMTSFVFEVRSIPAALYKALGGFATNGVNLTKLESYQKGAGFRVAMFYCEIEGHPQDENVRLAMEELSFFSADLKILGVFPAAEYRKG